MPKLDGFETATIIKRSIRTRDIPIIFVTALNKDERYIHKGYDHGAVDYVHKPYDPHILKSKVAVFADLARKTRRLIQAEHQLRLTEKKERERQFAQLELRSLRREQAEQKKYLDLVEGINHGVVWSIDASSFTITFVSPSAERLFGYPHDQWFHEQSFLMNHIHPDDREIVQATIKRVVVEKVNLDFEHRMIRYDGTEMWLHTGVRLASNGEEGRQELRGLSIDITKNKEAEEILRENQRRADFLAQASLALTESLDYSTTLSNMKQLVVPRISDRFFVHILDREGGIETLFESTDFINEQIDNVLNRGETVLLSESSVMVPLIARGKTFGVMTFLNESSERKFSKHDISLIDDLAQHVSVAVDNAKLYQQAQSAVRVRDEFLSIASHELQTPLTPLKLQTQILMRLLQNHSLKEIKPEKIDQILKTSDRQIGRLSSLIDSLMDVSKINNGKLKLEASRFDIIPMIDDILDRFANQFANAECKVGFGTELEYLIVHVDQFRLEQVIVNLLTNAIKYGAGKPIHISLAASDESFQFSVKDGGIGIAAKDQKRIFNRFERVISETSVAGLGLGLYIVKQIVDAHGGTIRVQSETGQGSVFTISLPNKKGEAPSPFPC